MLRISPSIDSSAIGQPGERAGGLAAQRLTIDDEALGKHTGKPRRADDDVASLDVDAEGIREPQQRQQPDRRCLRIDALKRRVVAERCQFRW